MQHPTRRRGLSPLYSAKNLGTEKFYQAVSSSGLLAALCKAVVLRSITEQPAATLATTDLGANFLPSR